MKRGQLPLIKKADLCNPWPFYLGLTYKTWERRKDYPIPLGFSQQIAKYLVTETEILPGS